jgi:hypothetical protein
MIRVKIKISKEEISLSVMVDCFPSTKKRNPNITLIIAVTIHLGKDSLKYLQFTLAPSPAC